MEAAEIVRPGSDFFKLVLDYHPVLIVLGCIGAFVFRFLRMSKVGYGIKHMFSSRDLVVVLTIVFAVFTFVQSLEILGCAIWPEHAKQALSNEFFIMYSFFVGFYSICILIEHLFVESPNETPL